MGDKCGWNLNWFCLPSIPGYIYLYVPQVSRLRSKNSMENSKVGIKWGEKLESLFSLLQRASQFQELSFHLLNERGTRAGTRQKKEKKKEVIYS